MIYDSRNIRLSYTKTSQIITLKKQALKQCFKIKSLRKKRRGFRYS